MPLVMLSTPGNGDDLEVGWYCVAERVWYGM